MRPEGVVQARVGQIVTFFAYRPPSRPQGSLTPTQPGRVTNPTLGHPGPPWEAPQAECRSLRREPKPHRPSTGSCHRARSGSTARPGQANGCHLACIQGVPGGSSGAPDLSARDIYELGLSPLSLSTIATLSGSHVIAGAAAAIGLALGYLLLLHMGMGGQ